MPAPAPPPAPTPQRRPPRGREWIRTAGGLALWILGLLLLAATLGSVSRPAYSWIEAVLPLACSALCFVGGAALLRPHFDQLRRGPAETPRSDVTADVDERGPARPVADPSILAALETIPDDDFVDRSTELVEQWGDAEANLATVAAVLRFMEAHPDVEFGMPGALVHFVERFHRRGYEPLLLDSIARRPTAHTAWMLSRVINGAEDEPSRAAYVHALRAAAAHPSIDADTAAEIAMFLADA